MDRRIKQSVKLQTTIEPIQRQLEELDDDQSAQLVGGAAVTRGSGVGPIFTNRKKRKEYIG